MSGLQQAAPKLPFQSNSKNTAISICTTSTSSFQYRKFLLPFNSNTFSAGTPVVGEVTGSTEFESRKGLLHWRVPLIDSSSNTGSMEFTVPAANASSFFPVHVSFRSNTTFCALQVVAVSEEGSNSNVEFTQDTSLTVEQYDIE